MAARTDSAIIASDNNEISSASYINGPIKSDFGVTGGGQRALGDAEGISPRDDAIKIDGTVCRNIRGSVRDSDSSRPTADEWRTHPVTLPGYHDHRTDSHCESSPMGLGVGLGVM